MKRNSIIKAACIAVLPASLTAAQVFAPAGGGGGGGGGGVAVEVGTDSPPAGTCDAQGEVGNLYQQSGDPATVNLQLFRCTQVTDTTFGWHSVAYNIGTTPPTTCTVGNVFFDTNASSGLDWLGCTASNTWTTMASGFSDPGAGMLASTDGGGTLAARTITAGEAMTCSNGSGVAGNPTCGFDRALGVVKGYGTADPPAACGDTGDAMQLGDLYLETDTVPPETSICSTVDTWTLLGSGGSGSFVDPSTSVHKLEEFIAGDDAGGENELFIGVVGSGTQALTASDNLTVHPGIHRITTSTTDNSGARVEWVNQIVATTSGTGWGDQLWEIEGLFRMSETDGTSFFFGLGDNGTIASTAKSFGVWRDTDLSHTAFVCRMCDSNTSGCTSAGDDTNQDTVDSSITPADATWFRIKLARTAAGGGTFTCQVNSETAKTFCATGCDEDVANAITNTDEVRVTTNALTRDTTSKTIDIDYMMFKFTGMTRF